ncbi:cell wall hydrolase [Methylobacterium sp. Leaf87]|nr:cell wall hydrolase [Methylobacterium sp. Leaf87]
MGTKRVRRDSSLRWFSAAMAPWAAGMGFLVSFTASAGTDGTTRSLAHDVRIASALPHGVPLIGGRVSTERMRAGLPAELDRGTASVLHANLSGSANGALLPGPAVWNPELEPDLGFVPPPADGEETIETSDGATPAIPRAVALSSTTPAPADATPIEVAAANLAIPGGLAIPGFSPRRDAEGLVGDSARHRYADLIGPDALDREQRCLAEAVYFEARSEPEDGQAAVAQVVLNRVKSGLYPSNVCGVVYQNRHRYMGCQFSFACEGKSLRITDGPSWQSATRIASAVIEGRTYLSEVGGATHYHADYVKPGWSRRLRKMDVIGRHIFYQLKRGQT